MLVCGPAAAFSPQNASSCEEFWSDNVKTMTYFKDEMEKAWALSVDDPEQSAGIFATIRNWQGHSVDFSNCVGVTSLTANDVYEMSALSDDFVDLANCGLSVADMSIASRKWHSSREPWLNQATDSGGQLRFTDADMRRIAEDILRYSQAAMGSTGCQSYRYAMDWATSTKNWAVKMLQNPRFAN